ncbi:6-carboxyhexanoate--CoA ligase [Hydrogenivirga caldilitoris]|uniref:6-carboxyhexanoate--CoA ligase n=2 Tax=Hydrogenivirga caldilitoris TaxID=246264 RepID=A0A497XVW8_9AQUI|nr:6-carboxyhexanoate--CoA ligase [Hydrogenivirga caldilitoris]
MRASLKGKHVSGGERIITEEAIPEALCELLKRPREHDFLKLTLERIGEVEVLEYSLAVSSFEFASVEEARKFALEKLVEIGVPESTVRRGIQLLSEGPNPRGGNTRGAVLMDIETGERLEPDPERGVRTVRVDWRDRFKVMEHLRRQGFTERTLDALAIATKNVYCGVVAELCWSDDPDYITGYVASSKYGYVRITPLKEEGDPFGGRIYFIRREGVGDLIRCLEGKPLLIDCLPP